MRYSTRKPELPPNTPQTTVGTRWLPETSEDIKELLCLYFSRHWPGSIWPKIYIFHLLHYQPPLTRVTPGLEKCWHNQSHRGVVYPSKFYEDAVCKSKFLMELNKIFQPTHMNPYTSDACSTTMCTLTFLLFIDLRLNKHFLSLWLFVYS